MKRGSMPQHTALRVSAVPQGWYALPLQCHKQGRALAEFELSEYRFFVYLGENVSCFVILFVLLYCQKSECDFEDEDSEVSHCIDYILFPLHKWSFVTWKGCDSKPYLVAEFVITLRSDKVGCGFRLFLL